MVSMPKLHEFSQYRFIASKFSGCLKNATTGNWPPVVLLSSSQINTRDYAQ